MIWDDFFVAQFCDKINVTKWSNWDVWIHENDSCAHQTSYNILTLFIDLSRWTCFCSPDTAFGFLFFCFFAQTKQFAFTLNRYRIDCTLKDTNLLFTSVLVLRWQRRTASGLLRQTFWNQKFFEILTSQLHHTFPLHSAYCFVFAFFSSLFVVQLMICWATVILVILVSATPFAPSQQNDR